MGLFGPPDVERLRAKGDVQGLVKALGYQKDEDVCVAAARALDKIGAPAVRPLMVALENGRIGEVRAVELLVRMLTFSDDDSDVRMAAAAALGQIGAPAVEPLMAALVGAGRWDSWGRACAYRAVVDALGRVGAPAVAPLVAALTDSDLRAVAAEALGKIGWRPEEDENGVRYWIERREWDKCVAIGAPAVELLIAALPGHEAEAAKALGKIGDARAVEPLIAALKKGGYLRPVAAEALGMLGWQPGQDEDGARYWMGRGKWDQCVAIGAPAVEPLVAALKEREAAAAAVLGRIGDARAVEPLVAALTSPSENVREAAADALGQLGVPAAGPLIARLTSEDENVRRAAAAALGQLGAPIVEPLIAALKSPAAEVLEATAEALGRIGWQPGQDEDGARYWMGRGEWDECVAIGAPAVEPLIARLGASAVGKTSWQAMVKGDRDYFLRSAAVDALGQIGASAVEPLIAALSSSNPNVREAAATALGQIGDVRALKRLESLAARDTYSQEIPGLNPMRFDGRGDDGGWLREKWEDTHEYPVRRAASRAVHEIRHEAPILTDREIALPGQGEDVSLPTPPPEG